MNEQTAAGKFDQIKGKVKESVGEAVGNDRMANSGAADQVKGAAKEGLGNAKDAFRDLRDNSAASTRTADANDSLLGSDSTPTSGAHDVRQKMVSTAENVKNAIKEKADHVRRSA